MPVMALKRSVSSESIELPEGQPEIPDLRPNQAGGDQRHRREICPEYDETPVDRESADRRGHGLCTRCRRKDDPGAAELQ